MAEDWRLQGQESFLTGRAMRRATWWSDQVGGDHDHCAFCTAEISADTTGHADYDEGWVTDDDYHRVCVECFEDFREQFKWRVRLPTGRSAGP
jgi:hypothetical protein